MSNLKDLLADTTPFDPTKLSEGEAFWRDHQKWLEDCGYMLRDRYMLDWKPSWLGTKKKWYTCEDGQIPVVSWVIQSVASAMLTLL
jgi:hypothetical protein